jgi:CMP/dCMP kinase
MQKTQKIIVAMDGTAGSGKSSICKEAISRRPWSYLNTGILYRATAYLLQQNNIDPKNQTQLKNFAEKTLPKLSWNSKKGVLFYDNKNIMAELLQEQTGQLTSKISQLAEIRKLLLPLQRDLTLKQEERVILVDGRDISTVVFPDAPLKVFITSDPKIRAKRRLEQLNMKMSKESIVEMEKKILQRDKQDQKRENAPLLKHSQAFELDTSLQSLEESVGIFIGKVEETINKFN